MRNQRSGKPREQIAGGPVLQAGKTRRTEKGSVPEAIGRRQPWLILSLLFALTVILFIARQALSVMAPVLRTVFHLSNEQYGRIVSALGLGMMSGEFPMGMLMDWLGARLGLSLAVFWWSAATGSLALAGSGMQLGLSQLWKGSGECGAYSGGIKTITRLFEKKDRTLAIGIFNGGSVIGATLAPPVIVYLLQHYGFRIAFLAPTAAGFLWIPLWWFLYKQEPKASTDATSPRVSIRQMLGNSSSWAVMLCRFFVGPVMQFYWYWTPSYLFSARHMTMTEIGLLGWIPFLMGDVGGVLGGWFAGALLRRGFSVRNTRRISMYGSALICGVSVVVPYMHGIGAALTVISIAIAADNFISAHMFAAVTDLFPDEQVGRATGLTGVAGGLSGMLFPLLTGLLVDRISYTPVFVLVAIMPMIGALALFAAGRQYRLRERLRLPAAQVQ
ncbi:MAG TPA: MFS transporter [Terracidiphilus sp.]|nr:MFS transporter [Terracidiphilus sp.]